MSRRRLERLFAASILASGMFLVGTIVALLAGADATALVLACFSAMSLTGSVLSCSWWRRL